MNCDREAFIVEACRSPRGRGKSTGALAGVHPQELFAQALLALADRVAVEPGEIDDVVCGVSAQVGEQGGCLARHAILSAGWALDTSGVVLNRHCASGLQAVIFAAMGVRSDVQQAVIAGGVESMSRRESDGAGLAGHNERVLRRYPVAPQGLAADLLATIAGISRAQADAYALESQRRCARAVDEGRFRRSLFAVRNEHGEVVLERDEHPRPETSQGDLSRLPPAFESTATVARPNENRSYGDALLARFPDVSRIEPVHHAGNSSGVVDGSAAVLVASGEFARVHGLERRARFVSCATVASDPLEMLSGAAPAARRALDAAGMIANDIDVFEVNEAFAAVPIVVTRSLGLDPEKVNPNGGAIALGHPIGATGAMLVGTLIDEMERRDASTGLVAMCVGGGMGVAAIFERA